MSVVISGSLVLGGETIGGGVITANNPVIGYRTLVNASNVSATTQAAGFPASNLANPSTNLRWQGQASGADQFVTLALNTNEQVDYLGIARHNLASAQIPVSIEALNASSVWVPLAGPVILPNDGPVLFRFTPQGITSIRVRMQPGNAAPTAAVIYAGKLLVLMRRIYVGHTPINFGRRAKVTNARSESGNFLGRIVLSEMTETSVQLQDLTPGWFRSEIDPFVKASKEQPFFFAWRPGDYPFEVGYCWMTNDPRPSNQRANGMMQMSFEMAGIV
jgi:hypothetical protein